jgi:hypothetical protein
MYLKKLAESIKIDEEKRLGIDSKAFVDSINKIDDMIGLADIKNQLAKHLKHAMRQCELGENCSNFHNIIITGGPGRGKTELAKKIGQAFIAMGFFGRNQYVEDNVSYDIPINEFIKIMRTFKKNSITHREIKREKYRKNPYGILRRHKHLNRRLANACIYRSIFGKIPILSGDSDKIVADITDGKYDDPERRLPEDYDIDKMISIESQEKVPLVGKCRVFSKDDLVGSYVGQTAIKTLKALQDCKGGVFILDEAYALLNMSNKGDKPCSFGIESLNKTNQYLSEHQSDQMVIFCGYRDFISYLFDNQKGLRRRFKTIYNIEEYSTKELIEIFFQKLPPRIIDEIPDMDKFREKLSKSMDGYKFPHQGGDMITLAQIVTIEFDWIDGDKKMFDELIECSLKELDKKHKEEGSVEQDSLNNNIMYI